MSGEHLASIPLTLQLFGCKTRRVRIVWMKLEPNERACGLQHRSGTHWCPGRTLTSVLLQRPSVPCWSCAPAGAGLWRRVWQFTVFLVRRLSVNACVMFSRGLVLRRWRTSDKDRQSDVSLPSPTSGRKCNVQLGDVWPWSNPTEPVRLHI